MAQEKKKTSPNVSGSAYYSIRNKNRVEQKKVLSRWNGAGSVMQTSVLSNNKSQQAIKPTPKLDEIIFGVSTTLLYSCNKITTIQIEIFRQI